MNNWQDWAVIFILIICFGWVAYKIYHFIMRTKRNESPCSSCASGCALKNSINKDTTNSHACGSSGSKKSTESFEKNK